MHQYRFKGRRFIFVVLINLLVSVLELILGIISQSLALVSDAFHNIEDAASVFISYIAWIYSFKGANREKTYGYKRAEVIAAFVNSIFLIIISVFIIAEGIKRYFLAPVVNADIMLFTSILAFLVNAISAFIIHNDSHYNINWKSAYLHMLGDALFSLAVMVGAFFVKRHSILWIDPFLSLIIGCVMIYQGWKVLRRSFNILMQSSADLNYESIKKDI
ncbi:MAG: cation diffusion facilitator family transporter, partial [Elusimicrobiales bacterium]